MHKIHVTWQFFEATDPQGHFFEKKRIIRYGLGKWLYQISGLYRFSFAQEVASFKNCRVTWIFRISPGFLCF